MRDAVTARGAALRARAGASCWRAPAPTLPARSLGAIAGGAARAGGCGAELAAPRRLRRAGAARARALATLLAGAARRRLLVDSASHARDGATPAYAGPPRAVRAPLRRGLVRTPGMVSVRAVELLVYVTLAIGRALRARPRRCRRSASTPARLALAVTACLAPAMALGALSLRRGARRADADRARPRAGAGARARLRRGRCAASPRWPAWRSLGVAVVAAPCRRRRAAALPLRRCGAARRRRRRAVAATPRWPRSSAATAA